MSQLSFLSIAQYRKTLRCERFLHQMDQVVPWKKLCKIIKPYHQEPPTGRKPIAIFSELINYFSILELIRVSLNMDAPKT